MTCLGPESMSSSSVCLCVCATPIFSVKHIFSARPSRVYSHYDWGNHMGIKGYPGGRLVFMFRICSLVHVSLAFMLD